MSPPLAARSTRLAAIALVGCLAGLAVAFDWQSPVRAGLTFVFLLFGPGLAIGELLAVRDPVQRLAIAAGISFAIDTLVALALLYLGVLSGGLAFAIVFAITAAVLAATVLRPANGLAVTDTPPRRHSAT